MSIKTLTEILGLSLELKDYEDRVQKRYDYIQEQLEKDPNWIGYDYPEYWTAYIEAHFILKDILVSTTGVFYKVKNGEIIELKTPIPNKNVNGGYLSKKLSISKNVKKGLRIHRVLGSTFVPKTGSTEMFPYFQLEVNHKNGIKHDNDISNLEWMTSKENTQHAIKNGLFKTGLENTSLIPVLATVTVAGPYKDKQFVMAGENNYIFSKINRGVISQALIKNKLAYGCKWEIIDRKDFYNFNLGPPTGYLKFIHENKHLIDLRIKPLVGEVMVGPFKGFKFVILGKRELISYGFNQARVAASVGKSKTVFGCIWKYVKTEEAENFSREIPKDILNTLVPRN